MNQEIIFNKNIFTIGDYEYPFIIRSITCVIGEINAVQLTAYGKHRYLDIKEEFPNKTITKYFQKKIELNKHTVPTHFYGHIFEENEMINVDITINNDEIPVNIIVNITLIDDLCLSKNPIVLSGIIYHG